MLEVRLNKDFHSEEYKVRFKGYTSEDDMWLPSSAFKEPVTFETVSRRGRHRKHTMKGGLFGVDVQRSRQSKTPTTRAGCKRQHARDSNEGQFYVVVYSDHIPTILSCNFNLARNVSSECKKKRVRNCFVWNNPLCLSYFHFTTKSIPLTPTTYLNHFCDDSNIL